LRGMVTKRSACPSDGSLVFSGFRATILNTSSAGIPRRGLSDWVGSFSLEMARVRNSPSWNFAPAIALPKRRLAACHVARTVSSGP
jgi:hypothetical protein